MKDKKNLNAEFTPSFTPNIGLAVLLNTGAAAFYHLISDTRWNNGEYEVLLHVWLGDNYGLSDKEIFTSGRWETLKEASDNHADTKATCMAKPTKVFNMAKISILPPLGF